MTKKFVVWRRNDGYINCTTYIPSNWIAPSGMEISFEVLDTFENWEDACALIEVLTGPS